MMTRVLIAACWYGVSAPVWAQGEVSPPQDLGAESGAVDIQIRRLSDLLMTRLDELPGDLRYQRLGVSTLDEKGRLAKEKNMGELVSALITTHLRRDHGLNVVERSRLKEVLEQLSLTQAGLSEGTDALDVGKLLDVQALVLGEVTEVGDHFVVTARVVSAADAKSLAADSVEIPVGELIAFSSDAVVLRSRTDALFRSVVPGWGQAYNKQPVKAGIFAGLQGALLLGALAFHLRGQGIEDSYNRVDATFPNPSRRAQRLRHDAEDKYRFRNAMLYSAAVLWVIGMIDAYASGVDPQG